MAVVMNVQFSYDESTLYERVVRLPGPERTLFAAACAERLMPLYEWVASVEPCVRPALDLVWSPSATSEQVEQAQMEVEKLVPDEDDEHAPVEVAQCRTHLPPSPTHSGQPARKMPRTLSGQPVNFLRPPTTSCSARLPARATSRMWSRRLRFNLPSAAFAPCCKTSRTPPQLSCGHGLRPTVTHSSSCSSLNRSSTSDTGDLRELGSSAALRGRSAAAEVHRESIGIVDAIARAHRFHR